MPVNSTSHIDSYFVSMLSIFNLNHLIFLRNVSNVVLDLVLSNTHLVVSNDYDPLLPLDKHHPALIITINCCTFNLLVSPNYYYDFNNCNYTNLLNV